MPRKKTLKPLSGSQKFPLLTFGKKEEIGENGKEQELRRVIIYTLKMYER